MGSKPNWGAFFQALGQGAGNYANMKLQEQRLAEQREQQLADIEAERQYRDSVWRQRLDELDPRLGFQVGGASAVPVGAGGAPIGPNMAGDLAPHLEDYRGDRLSVAKKKMDLMPKLDLPESPSWLLDEGGSLVPMYGNLDSSLNKVTVNGVDERTGLPVGVRIPGYGSSGGGVRANDLEPDIPATTITGSGEVSTRMGFVPQDWEFVYPGITGLATNEYKRLIAMGMPLTQQTSDAALEAARAEYLRGQDPYFGGERYDTATGQMYDSRFYQPVADKAELNPFRGGPAIKRADGIDSDALNKAIGGGQTAPPVEFADYYRDNIERYVKSGVVPSAVVRKWAEELGVPITEINSLIAAASAQPDTTIEDDF